MESTPSVVQQQRMEVDQLRREATMKRIPVSQAVEDIKAYVTEKTQDDYLLIGFHGKNQNPFREKSSCSVL
ncbi:guanine nucleotide-binding protein subunit gamma-1-like [Tigriopus californicus]|uniref:guanine nucleotide-binding protein subunit gamma-1-like n=1 Tax=Tigriopus californicus TaxID=6832 RepID=UPI0027D9EFE8|nr:guanine nucleotide-binding protein subunit gamma-1-like [Tigriopus californicus]